MPRGGKRSTSFQPGQSGNPGGRPKVVKDVQDAARKHSADAISTLAGIMNNTASPEASRIAAATALLDRGYGKPQQTIDSTNTNVNYAVSDEPQTESEWQAEHVTEH